MALARADTITNVVDYDWQQLRETLLRVISDEDLRTMCFDLAVNYDMLPGRQIRDRLVEFLKYFRDARRMPVLIHYLIGARDNVNWTAFEKSHASSVISETDAEVRAKLIEVKARFFDEVTHTFWNWRYLVIKVTYYGGYLSNKSRYLAAGKEYDERVWDVLFEIRTAISTSQLFVRPATYRRLLVLYDLIVRTDNELSVLIKSKESLGKRKPLYSQFNQHIYTTVTEQIDTAVGWIAQDLDIAETRDNARDQPNI